MHVRSAVCSNDLAEAGRSILFASALFLLCLFGIFTRPGVDLASFWPANAFMLGMMIRFPVLATPLSWVSCAVGFMLADLVTGGSAVNTVVLNLGNLVAIAVGYLVLSRFDQADQRLSRPASVLFMLVAITAAALTVGLIGMIADPILFGGRPFDALLFWSATELVNYVAFLPMILTFPNEPLARLRKLFGEGFDVSRLLPLLALVATALAGAAIGGPGALAFPVLALLWCALTYSLFVTASLAFVFVAWTLLAVSTGYLPVADQFTNRATQLSIRFAVSLMGLAPLVVASVMAAREELLQRLLVLSSHDQMTGVLNRSAFLSAAAGTIDQGRGKQRPVAALMLDIDHFKSINDRYGHAAGDRVLISFARLLKNNVRKQDIVGRLGGEEFAVLLDDCTMDEAKEIAARLNRAFEADFIPLDDGRRVEATVSIGLAFSEAVAAIDRLLARADDALYRAKGQGRNRFEVQLA